MSYHTDPDTVAQAYKAQQALQDAGIGVEEVIFDDGGYRIVTVKGGEIEPSAIDIGGKEPKP